VTPHPVIGAGIETVLQLEGRYEVRRAGRLADGVASARGWPADVVLVDGVLLGSDPVDFGAPAYVLSGDPGQGELLAAELPGARGWLPKDVPPGQLLDAIDAAIGVVRVEGDVRGTLSLLVAVLVVLLFLAAIALAVWRFVLGG
jgi:DNA-binding NarL/FixJ family response regulator